ncbi:MAG: porin family protein [Bacteroidales bacterium]|nr:porin family protein [Bacteroidales bacterium]
MKRYFVILALLLLATSVQAQRIKAYVAGGFTASHIEGDELYGFHKWGGMFGVGALAPIAPNNRVKFGVEADYTLRGAKNTSGVPYNINLPLQYVDIPLTIYYNDPKAGFAFGAGLTYGRLVQQPHDTISFGPAFIPDTNNLHFLTNDFLFHMEARFQVWEWIFFSIRYQRSIMPINSMTFTEDAATPPTYTNDCFNTSVQCRLELQFGDPNESSKGYRGKKKYHKRRR